MERVSDGVGRVRQPESFPRERLLLGELHLLRGRLDSVLADLAELITIEEPDEGWLRVEEAGRLARRALTAAVSAVPPLPRSMPAVGELAVGPLRVDSLGCRQWFADAEFELSPLHHRLLAVMAADPFRVFGKAELLREVWRRSEERTEAVKTSVSRVRRALEAAGAPAGMFMISAHAVGWSLTRPER